MKAILIDDESLALDYLEKLLVEDGRIDIIGKYINPEMGLQAIVDEKPDVVFLDIEMPSMNGIELADKIQQIRHTIKIVFITAYNEYAVKAFEINAVDYVMKPVRRQRLNDTISRIIDKKTDMQSSSEDYMICCFQSLQFIRTQTKAKIEVRWRTKRAKEIFCYLIHHRKNPVRKDELIELFWPDVDYDRAYTQLYSTIYQIRRTLTKFQLPIQVLNQNDTYILDLKKVQLDVDDWEKAWEALKLDQELSINAIKALLDLYSGDYLKEESYLWSENERERLRTLLLHHVSKVGDHFQSKGDDMSAILLYQRVQSLIHYWDESYKKLMVLYDRIGNRKAVHQQYQNLIHMLDDEYGVQPDISIQNWYLSWEKDAQ